MVYGKSEGGLAGEEQNGLTAHKIVDERINGGVGIWKPMTHEDQGSEKVSLRNGRAQAAQGEKSGK